MALSSWSSEGVKRHFTVRSSRSGLPLCLASTLRVGRFEGDRLERSGAFFAGSGWGSAAAATGSGGAGEGGGSSSGCGGGGIALRGLFEMGADGFSSGLANLTIDHVLRRLRLGADTDAAHRWRLGDVLGGERCRALTVDHLHPALELAGQGAKLLGDLVVRLGLEDGAADLLGRGD